MSILITRPRHDTPTHYLFCWTEKIIQEAQRKKLHIIDLTKNKAVKKKVQSYLSKNIPRIVFFNGHGSASCVTGHENEILISIDDGVKLLKGKIVFMRACSAGKILGPAIIEHGANGFIGYKEDFVFLHDKDFFNNPLGDKLASPFMECSNQVAISLVKGCSAKDANRASKKIYKKRITEMLNSEADNPYVLPFLIGNMKNQIHL